MTCSPIVWGTSLACALGGALAGNALGSAPVLDRPTIGSFYQTHEDSAGGVEADAKPLPDHYPLVTPEGVIPVAALSTRGLYSQARYRPYARYADVAEPDPGGADDSTQPKPGPTPGDAGQFAQRPLGESGAVSDGGKPIDLADGPVTVARGRAKLIDVEATLALR